MSRQRGACAPGRRRRDPRRARSGGSAPGRSSTDSRTRRRWSLLAAASASPRSPRSVRPGAGAWSRAGCGVGLPLPSATAAYYRSQFLNTALPGGVLGDVHRGVATVASPTTSDAACGPSAGSGPPGRSSRSCWPSSCSSGAAFSGALVDAGRARAWGRRGDRSWSDRADRAAPGRRRAGPARARTAAADIRDGLLDRRAWPGVVLASSSWSSGTSRRSSSPPGPPGSSASTAQLVCRWRCSRCWPWRCRRTSAAGVRARAWRRGRSAPPGSAPTRASPPPTVYGVLVVRRDAARVLRCSSSRGCGARARSCRHRRRARRVRGMTAACRTGERRAWLTVRTPCSAAACRSTATSTAPPRDGCRCPTTPTSTGSTRCAPRATRSWSARPRSATTTRGCWCAAQARRADRVARGMLPSPVKVTVTAQRPTRPVRELLHLGETEKLVYCASSSIARRARPTRRRRDGRRRRASRSACNGSARICTIAASAG